MMWMWLILIGGSVLLGVLCSYIRHTKIAIYMACLLPWVSFLGALLYSVYVIPHQQDALWLIAQLTGGTLAAAIGGFSCLFCRRWHKVP